MINLLRFVKRLPVAFVLVIVVIAVILGVVLAQDEPNRTVQNLDAPKIDMPWEQKPGPTSSTPVEIPTATPNDEQAKSLPIVTPPVLPTVQVIEVSPGFDMRTTYDVVIKRAGTGELVYIRVPVTMKSEDVIGNYLNDGDEVVRILPPPLGGPPPAPLNSISTDK